MNKYGPLDEVDGEDFSTQSTAKLAVRSTAKDRLGRCVPGGCTRGG